MHDALCHAPRLAAGFALAAACGLAPPRPPSLRLRRGCAVELTLPPGFSISVYADNVPNARSMTLGPGHPVCGHPHRRKRLRDPRREQRQKADRVVTLATGLEMPNGVAMRDGSLYVAEVSRILRFDNIEASLDKPPAPAVVIDSYPKDRHHGWKFMAFGPDGWLYVPVGAPCNVCERPDPRYSPSRESSRTARALKCSPAASGTRWASTAPGHEGALVHRQRPGHAWRRRSAG